jgi:subtilase family serine protease
MKMKTITENSLMDLWGSSADNLFVVGSSSTILHYPSTVESPGSLPDLQVTEIVSSQAVAGQTVEVKWTVSNNGDEATSTPTWYDRVWISPDLDVRPGHEEDVLLGEFQNVSYLGAGESYIQTQQVSLPNNVKGTYYLFIVTDNYDAYNINEDTMEASTHIGTKVNLVPETNNRNNFKFIEIDIEPPPPSDLSVASVIAPAESFSGQQISISYTVENAGENNTNAEAWWDAVYLTQDTELNTETATLLGKYSHAGTAESTGMLAPGETYQMSADVNIPHAVYGDYYIFVVTDIYDDVFEYFGENNNTYRNEQAITVILTPPPDLVVTEHAAPDSADSGQSVSIQWTVENQGAGEPFETYWRDGVYLHTGPVFDAESAILIGSFGKSAPLSAGSDYSKDVSVTVPNGLEGSYFLFIKADDGNQVFEHLYEDNNVSAADPVQIRLSPWADLQVSDIQIPASVTAGEKVNITFTVANNGEASAAGTWTDSVYISEDAAFSTEDDILLETVLHTASLPATGSYSRTANVAIPTDADGVYYIFVVTDAEDAVYEHTDEDNNTAQSVEMTVLSYPPVDLSVPEFEVSFSASSGQPVDVSYTVENSGEGTTLSSRWYDAFYLSSDMTLDTDEDILIDDIRHDGSLGYQETYSPTVSMYLPNGISGLYFLLMKTDSYNGISESNETNNTSFAPVFITLTPPPDLQITAYDIPSQGTAGQPLTVSWTVENKGTGPARYLKGWNDGIFLSSDAILDRGDTCLSSESYADDLGPGANYNASAEVELPISASGNYFVLIKTDSGKNVYEHEAEDNNVISGSVSVTMPPPSDLIVTDITVPANAVPGELVTISWTVKNQGPNTASGRMYEAVYVSEDANWEFTDPMLGIVSREIDLAPGKSARMSMKADIRRAFRADKDGTITETLPGVVGEHYVAVRTDVRNNIRESDLSNNIAISDDVMDVSYKSLQLDVPASATLSSGQMIYYRIDTPASQTMVISLSSDVSGEATELYVSYDRSPSRIDSDYTSAIPFESNQEVVIPRTEEGTYFILIYGSSITKDSIPLTVQADILDFELRKLDPVEGGQSGEVTIRLDGALFQPNMFVMLENETNYFDAAKVYWVNESEAYATFNLRNVPLGTYDVKITQDESYIEFIEDSENPVQKVTDIKEFTLPDAFTVVPSHSVPFEFYVSGSLFFSGRRS